MSTLMPATIQFPQLPQGQEVSSAWIQNSLYPFLSNMYKTVYNGVPSISEVWVINLGYGSPIEDAINSIGSNNVTLHIPSGIFNISDNFTVPANINLRPERGAILTIATTKTLTINGPLDAGPYQIFSCTGTGQVVFGPGSVTNMFPEWWGITGTADDVAINACITAADNRNATVFLSAGKTYHLADQIVMLDTRGITIAGNGAILQAGAFDKSIVQLGDYTGTVFPSFITIRNLLINGMGYDTITNGLYPNQHGLTIGNGSNITIEGGAITNIPGVGLNGKKALAGSTYFNRVAVYNTKISLCGSSGISIGRLDWDDASVGSSDDFSCYNVLVGSVCKGVNRGGWDLDFAGVYLYGSLPYFVGGEVSNVGLDVTPTNGAVLGIYIEASAGGQISSVNFERVGQDATNSTDLRVISCHGLVITGTHHYGDNVLCAKYAIYSASCSGINVIGPIFVNGATHAYDYGVVFYGNNFCNVYGAIESAPNPLEYPCNTATVSITLSTNCSRYPIGGTSVSSSGNNTATLTASLSGMTYVQRGTATNIYNLPTGDLSFAIRDRNAPLVFTLIKLNANNLTIDPGTGNFIDSGGSGITFVNSTAGETYASVNLQLVYSVTSVNYWIIVGYRGTWAPTP